MSINLKQVFKICQNNPVFYFKKETINGISFIIFNYRLASYQDFKDYNAFELRGLTFREDTSERFWSIHKIFNVGEHEDSQHYKLQKRIPRFLVRDKEDGSLIQVINIDGNIYTKTKGTFYSQQAKIAKDFIHNKGNYRDFIYKMWSLGLEPLFELVSPQNQIVVFYPETYLVLIQVREKESGRYLPFSEYMDIVYGYGIEAAEDLRTATLEEILSWQKKIKNTEGWVISNPNNLWEMYKVKTYWYLKLHNLMADNNLRENILIQLILEEKIDDILSTMPESTKKEYIKDITKKINHYFGNTINELLKILENRKNYKNRKEFALAHKNHPYFSILIKFYNYNSNDIEERLEEALKKFIIFQTRKLNEARRFLEKIKDIDKM